MAGFSSSTRIAAPKALVWSVMTDHERYADWGRATKVVLEREGDPDRNGLGARRVFHAGPMRAVEEVTGWEPQERMAYRLVKGLPIRGYRSEMALRTEPAGDADDGRPVTVLDWSSTFEPRIPGTGRVMEWFLALAVKDFATGIKRTAEAGG